MDQLVSALRWLHRGTLAAIIFSVFPSSIGATELVSQGEKFVITRDFQAVVIDESNPHGARVFVNPVRLVTPPENLELYAFATRLLAQRVSIVSNKDDAAYTTELILKLMKNPAVRNPSGKWSIGFVLASICRRPIKQMLTDCGTMTYYFFSPTSPSGAFHDAFALWVDSILPASPSPTDSPK